MKCFAPLLIIFLAGCSRSFHQIDDRVELLMQEASDSMNTSSPRPSGLGNYFDPMDVTSDSPKTINPDISELTFVRAGDLDINSIAETLDNAAETLENSSRSITLKESLDWANSHAKEMQFAEYDYLTTTLSLLSELHLWGPRFFNTIDSDIGATSNSGLYDTSLEVVNDFSITRKLPNGGSLSANALTTIASRLHEATTSSDTSSSTLSITLEIPLMKGSGAVAREALVQARRSLVYAARTYERFRRVFYRELVGDYLSLVVQKQSLDNAQRSVDSLRQLAERQAALYESGRTRLYDSVDAENQALAAVARLSQSWERYRLALDRFKIRIGWTVDDPIQIVQTTLDIAPPLVDATESVELALKYRLDLQNEYDQLLDSKRDVDNAQNSLLPDVNFAASTSLDSLGDNPTEFDEKDFDYAAGISVSLPLDKEGERIIVRKKQIELEKSRRSFRESRDNVAVGVRASLRNIEVFQFSHELQLRNVEIAQLGLDSINADPDRVSVLDQTRAISDLQSAKDARDGARRDLELSILDYLLQAGQLRIGEQGDLVLPKANLKQ